MASRRRRGLLFSTTNRLGRSYGMSIDFGTTSQESDSIV